LTPGCDSRGFQESFECSFGLFALLLQELNRLVPFRVSCSRAIEQLQTHLENVQMMPQVVSGNA
jgi:hypothetical protein